MRHSVPLAVALLAPLAGCATMPLTAGGERVRVVEAAGPECQPTGPVRSLVWSHLGDLEVVDAALRDARNRAAEQGADTLVVSAPQVSSGDDTTTAVYLGTGYRCRREPSPSPGARAGREHADPPRR